MRLANVKRKMDNENEKQESEVLDFTKPDYKFNAGGIHEWRQEGYYLVCRSCEITHAQWIGKEKILVGFTEEKKPLFKTRKELNMS